MNFIDYYKVLVKNKLSFFLTLCVFVIATFVFTLITPTKYEGSVSLSVNPISKTSGKDVLYYEYDGFYAIQAAQFFANSISGWVKSPDIVLDIYQDAGVDLKVNNIKTLSKLIKTTSLETQLSTNVDLTISYKNKDELSKILESTKKIIQAKTQEYNTASSQKVDFNILTSSQVLVDVHPNWSINLLVGIFAGLIFGIIFAFIVEAIRQSKQQ